MPPVDLSLSPRRRMFDPAGRVLQRPSFRTPPFLPEDEAEAEAGMAENYGVTAPEQAGAPAMMPPPRLSPEDDEISNQADTRSRDYQDTLAKKAAYAAITPERPKLTLARRLLGAGLSFATNTQVDPTLTREFLEGQQRQQEGIGAQKELAGLARGDEERQYQRGRDTTKDKQFETTQDVELAKGGLAEVGPEGAGQGAQTYKLRGRTYADRPRIQNLTPQQAHYQEARQLMEAAGASPFESFTGLARASQPASQTPEEAIDFAARRAGAMEEAVQKARAKEGIEENGITDKQLQTTASALLTQANGDPKKAIESMYSPSLDPATATIVQKYGAPLMLYIRRLEANMGLFEFLEGVMRPPAEGGGNARERNPAPLADDTVPGAPPPSRGRTGERLPFYRPR